MKKQFRTICRQKCSYPSCWRRAMIWGFCSRHDQLLPDKLQYGLRQSYFHSPEAHKTILIESLKMLGWIHNKKAPPSTKRRSLQPQTIKNDERFQNSHNTR